MSKLDRRSFLASGVMVPMLGLQASGQERAPSGRAALVGSGNSRRSLERAHELIASGTDCLEAIVEGIAIVEDDPNDMSVGYGGLPNEIGVVELDASCMHGPTHKAGAVAALRNVKNPARVALEVLRRTDHVLLVGEGALQFARQLGFPEQDLLTDKSRQAWIRWKERLSRSDDWLDPDQQVQTSAERRRAAESAGGSGGGGGAADEAPIPYTDGTIHVSAVDAHGDLGGCTSTSGLSYKLPGRVGDSPIIAAGLFTDNQVGSAGATGRGEACIQSAAAFQVVRNMADGLEPTEACMAVLEWIADHTRRPDLLSDRGEPNFNVSLYAIRKDGVYGSAALRKGATFCYHDGTEARRAPCPALYS